MKIAIRVGLDYPNSLNRKRGTTLDPALKAKLVGVWSTKGKTNEDADRDVIKSKLGNGNDLVILNAAYKLNSGYGLWKENFNDGIWSKLLGVNKTGTRITLNSEKDWSKGGWITYKTSGNVIASFKVKISGMPVGGDLRFSSVKMVAGINIIPSYTATAAIGFIINSLGQDWSKLVIEQIPDYQGAFVTDGVNDVIISNKLVSDMLQGSTKCTVISVLKYISGNSRCNTFVASGYSKYNRATMSTTGIIGFTTDNVASTAISKVVLLGDHVPVGVFSEVYTDSKFLITGYPSTDGGIHELGSYAYYGGFMANDVLTTDEINQIVAYYNLDWWIEPDGWYDVAKQGITNENHSTFNDKLIDFSPNKRDLVCNNFSWGGNSGVGKWAEDFNSWVISSGTTRYGQTIIHNGNGRQNIFVLTFPANLNRAVPSITVNVDYDAELRYYYFENPNNSRKYILCKKGINVLPASVACTNPSMLGAIGFYVLIDGTYAKIEQIPEQEGGLWHDGADDHCQYVGDLGLKDYTVVVDRAYSRETPSQVPIISNAADATVSTPFLMEHLGSEKILAPHSFGKYTALSTLRIDRFVSYQSTYKYNGHGIAKGTNTDTGSGLTIGRFGTGSRYTSIGFYGLLLYPYSMNAFLIERQLKKRKFGTLYKNMMEWRPKVQNLSRFTYSFRYGRNAEFELTDGMYINYGQVTLNIHYWSDAGSNLIEIDGNKSIIRNGGADIVSYTYNAGRGTPKIIIHQEKSHHHDYGKID